MSFQPMDVRRSDEGRRSSVAERTGGRYFPRYGQRQLQSIYDEINQLEKEQGRGYQDYTVYHERFPGAAAGWRRWACCCVEFIFSNIILKRIPFDMFRFANGELLYLLILVPVLVAVYICWRWVGVGVCGAFSVTPPLLSELMPDFSRGRIRLKAALFIAAHAAGLLRRRARSWGRNCARHLPRGVEMMLVVDVSNSMMAEDFEPNRLSARSMPSANSSRGAAAAARGPVFAGEPKVQLPITSDYRMAQAFAKSVSLHRL